MKLTKYEIPDSTKNYKPKEPFIAKVVSNTRITGENTGTDIRNIILNLDGSGIKYMEGQSVGVVPPGTQENGKPHRIRLYSIASCRTGDDGLSKTVTLCVKRVVYTDPETNQMVRGLASNYLCNIKKDEEVALIGPTGRTFLLPEDHNVNLIMVAAGTGIAPFRAFIKKIYQDHGQHKGQVRLFFGARNGMENIYLNNKNNDIGQYMEEETFQAFQSFSNQYEPGVHKGYVQGQIEANKAEIWSMIKENNFAFYLCGMKEMEKSVDQVFQKLAEDEGADWDEMRKEFKKQGRWNIETY